MSTIKSFLEIEAWQVARQLSKDIFELTASGKFARDFGLIDQINRASGSVMDNIAEGFEREGRGNFYNSCPIPEVLVRNCVHNCAALATGII